VISGNLFTRDYLLEGIERTEQWKHLDDKNVAALKQRLMIIANNFLKIAKPNEAETEKDFIYPVLEALGWTEYQVQQVLSQKGRKQVPDALLFADTKAKNLAVGEAQQWKRFQHGLAVLEAKRWGRALDRADKRDPSEEGVPSTQMLQYLSRVDVQTNNKVRLGILTNGNAWRVYFQGALSVSEDYFEVDLAKALQLPHHELNLLDLADARLTPDRVLRLFVLMFGRPAFLPFEGARTFHDTSREAGKSWEEKVTKDLSKLVFGDLFPKLVAAIAKHDPTPPAAINQSYLDQVKQAALILLYRLLFVVYAEDRDLLPDQREPYKSYSLTTMRFDIAERISKKQTIPSSMLTYWPKLSAVFRAIAEGDDDLGIPPYNGGLFSKDSAPLLDRVQLPDDIVSALIYGLSHREEDGVARYINYRDLSVQQLGTIYERTLEYELRSEGGAVNVHIDDTARHESGSYYTPDSLVALIIEKSIGPFVRERLQAFRDRAEELGKDKRRVEIRHAELQGLDPASLILDLKICDPAMGSGHFLVSLVDWLADRVLTAIAESESVVDWSETPYRSPVLSSIEATRQDIIKQATQHKWPFVIEHLDDRHIIRRTILKRCIYGVDRNPMAVELAKVALWLHTFTVGAPLSFLDHHLRCGNSLFGYWIRTAMDRLTKWGGQLLINEPMKKAMAQAIAMQRLERVTDVDIAEVHESKTLFDGIEQETQPLNTFIKTLYALDWQKLDKEDETSIRAWLDGQFGDPFDVARGKLRLGSSDNGMNHPEAKDVIDRLPAKVVASAERFAGLLNRSRDLIGRERLQNWQVSFPGVWKQWESAKLNGGFDAVIGNPPYVRQELIKEYKPALKRAFAATYDGSADLYVYFYEQGLKLLRPGGRLSYVVTNKWMRGGYAEGLRDFFADESWIEFVADFGHAKNFFPDADVFPSILVIRKPNDDPAPIETEVCVIPRDDVPEKGLEAAVAKAIYRLPRAHFTSESWTLEPPAVVALLQKIRAAGVPLSELPGVNFFRGVTTGFNKAFVIDTAARDRLVGADPKAREIIKPYVRGQDIDRWRGRWAGLWLIFCRRGINIADYPSVLEHLEGFRSELEPKPDEWEPEYEGQKWLGRKEGSYAWYEIQDSVEYFPVFEGPKIVYQAIQFHPRYCLDTTGAFTSNKTFVIGGATDALAGILNSPLMWWFSWRHFVHMKDEALSNDGFKMNTLPISAQALTDGRILSAAGELAVKTAAVADQSVVIGDWLKQEFGIQKISNALKRPENLDSDSFVAAVRASIPKKRKLTAAEIAELRREYTTTIEPARKIKGEIFTLELTLSNLVNEAYGLTADEVQLMWETAPPRMPFTPAGFADVGLDSDQDE
jgi:hypothetical protein